MKVQESVQSIFSESGDRKLHGTVEEKAALPGWEIVSDPVPDDGSARIGSHAMPVKPRSGRINPAALWKELRSIIMDTASLKAGF